MMTYGVADPKTKRPTDGNSLPSDRFSYLRRRIEGKRKIGDADDDRYDPIHDGDRFAELIREVKERRQFLDQMRIMGTVDQYKTVVETEISQMVREMEVIDEKRSAQLRRTIESNQ